jgi:hypothetical protein
LAVSYKLIVLTWYTARSVGHESVAKEEAVSLFVVLLCLATIPDLDARDGRLYYYDEQIVRLLFYLFDIAQYIY